MIRRGGKGLGERRNGACAADGVLGQRGGGSRWRRWGAALSFLVVILISQGRVHADNCRQWGLTRDPCNACLMGRYFRMLQSRPNDPFPMSKLRRCRSLSSLIHRYERMLKVRPRWYAGQVILGHLYLAAGRPADAVAAYRKAVGTNPSRWDAYWSLGKAYQKGKKWSEAKTAFGKALGLVKVLRFRKKILRALIGVCISGRDMDGARAAFRKLVRLEPRNKSLRTEFARLLLEHAKYREAIAEYRVLLSQVHSDNRRKAELLRDIGEVYERQGKDTEAVRTYRKAMRLTTRGHWLRTELTQRIVAIYRRKNDLPSLAAYYERTWRSRGFFEWKVLAGVYDEMGRIDDAIKAYRRALRVKPSALDARDRLISLLIRAGRKDEALKALERQSRLAPGEPRYLIRLAKMYWRRRSPRRALALLAQCGRRFSSDPSVHSVLADLYSRWGRPKAAFREYQKLVRIDPTEPSHLVDLGEQYWQRGQTARARGVWRRLLGPGLYGSRQEAFAALAQVLADHGVLADAIRYFRRALALEPKNPALHRALAPVLVAARKYKAALSEWLKVLEYAKGESRKPWRKEARHEVIRLWKRMGVLRRKLKSYEQRFATSKNVEDGSFLAEAFVELGRLDKARAVIEALIAAHPKDIEVRMMLVDLSVRQRRLADAIAQLQVLARLLPAKARDFYMRIAELYLLAYQDDKALAFARKALELSKGDAEGWARVAGIYAKKGDEAKAVEAYERALAIRPRFFRVAFTLAGLYVRIGRYRRAAALYHDIVARSPSEEMVSQAGRQALDLDEYLGSFEDLERRLISLSFVYTHKSIYKKILMEVYSRWIPALVRTKWFAPDPKRREWARKRLHSIGMRALKPLLESLASKDPARRNEALRLLGHLGNKEAALPLVRLALDPPEDVPVGPERLRFQLEALIAAGRLGDQRAVPELGKMLSSSSTAIREAAAWGLALAGGKQAYRYLLTALDDRKVGVEALACLGLARYGDRAFARLSAVVSDSRRRMEVRAACAWSMGWSGRDAAVDELLELAFPDRSELSQAALWALGVLGNPKAVPRLASLVWSRRGRALDAALWALVRSAEGTALRWSSLGLEDLNLDASGRLPVVAFVRALRPRDISLSSKGRRALLSRYRSHVMQGLRRALSSHAEVVLAALGELDRLPGRFSLGRLDPDPSQKRMPADVAEVARFLQPVLKALTLHRLPLVRGAALSVLIKSLPADIPGILERFLADPDQDVRRKAVTAALALRAAPSAQRRRGVAVLVAAYPRLEGRQKCAVLRAVTGTARRNVFLRLLKRAAASKDGYEAQCALDVAAESGRKTVDVVGRVLARSDVAAVRVSLVGVLVTKKQCPKWSLVLVDDPDDGVRQAALDLRRRCRSFHTRAGR